MEHITGQQAKVEIWNSVKKQSDFFDCEILSTTAATDREYRVNIKILHNNVELRECAPECVIINK